MRLWTFGIKAKTFGLGAKHPSKKDFPHTPWAQISNLLHLSDESSHGPDHREDVSIYHAGRGGGGGGVSD